jgi:CheY-like chemotaxis protein
VTDAPRSDGLRILIVDDNVDAAESLRDVALLFDNTVEVAYGGHEAIEKARAFAPQVVLCDIGLPGLDGYGVARALRAEPSLRGSRLVAVSGYASAEDVRKAREAGFDEHLAKPPDFDRLERLLAHGRGSAPARA